jgi:hypothetical protein
MTFFSFLLLSGSDEDFKYRYTHYSKATTELKKKERIVYVGVHYNTILLLFVGLIKLIVVYLNSILRST